VSSISPRLGSVPRDRPVQLSGISSSAGYAFSCKKYQYYKVIQYAYLFQRDGSHTNSRTWQN